MNPETCILRSAESFYKRGKGHAADREVRPRSQHHGRAAGGQHEDALRPIPATGLRRSALFSVTYLLIGYLSRDFLAAVLRGFHAAGRTMEVAIIIALVVYAIYRVSQFHKYQNYRLEPRVQVQELAARLAAEGPDKVQIVDVRSHGYYDVGAERIRARSASSPTILRRNQKSAQGQGYLSLLYLSARSDQRPGGASTAGKRIQHVRDRRRADCVAQSRRTAESVPKNDLVKLPTFS